MNWRAWVIILSLALLHENASALTLRALTFEEVVHKSDVIAIFSIRQGTSDTDSEVEGELALRRFCGYFDSVLLEHDSSESSCFYSKDALKVGSRYFVFLMEDEAGYLRESEDGYVALLAMEIEGRNPHHEFEAVRWDALRDPNIAGLREKVAVVEYRDDRGIDEQRSIPVYAYFLLSDVEAVVREIHQEDRDGPEDD